MKSEHKGKTLHTVCAMRCDGACHRHIHAAEFSQSTAADVYYHCL